jgi:hypothetical protein
VGVGAGVGLGAGAVDGADVDTRGAGAGAVDGPEIDEVRGLKTSGSKEKWLDPSTSGSKATSSGQGGGATSGGPQSYHVMLTLARP